MTGDFFEVLEGFRDHARSLGIELPSSIRADGKLHRCGTTEKPSGFDAAYLLHLDASPTGMLQNFSAGMEEMEPWKPKDLRASPLERREWEERAKLAKVKAETEQAQREAEAATTAKELWNRAGPNGDHSRHPYLAKKGIKPSGSRLGSDGELLIPLCHNHGLSSLQRIFSDGSKKFLPGGRIKGCYCIIGLVDRNDNVFCIAEGFATAATIHEATKYPTIMAINAGNLMLVAQEFRTRYPKATIVICGDDDHATQINGKPENVGVLKAQAAALAVNAILAIPRFPAHREKRDTDFNDLQKLCGLAEVTNQIDAALITGPYVAGSPVSASEIPLAANGVGFQPSLERIRTEESERIRNETTLLSFGVTFLDDALTGIFRNDLVLLGAKSGSGKTALALSIGLSNSRKGRRVHYFALEAHRTEMEHRIKYETLASLYYSDPAHGPVIRFQDWMANKLNRQLAPYAAEADEMIRERLSCLSTYQRGAEFSGDEFAKQMKGIAGKTDLVILDHFHYIDNDDQNEMRGSKNMLKQIRNSVLEHDIPVIMVGHIRKADSRSDALVPTEDAFHGSSDLVKICTRAVMLAPDFEYETQNRALWATFMRVVKNRMDGSVTRYCARLFWDAIQNGYQDGYHIGKLSPRGDEFIRELAPERLPHWYPRVNASELP